VILYIVYKSAPILNANLEHLFNKLYLSQKIVNFYILETSFKKHCDFIHNNSTII